jgi:Family of unknown function (DUF5996)
VLISDDIRGDSAVWPDVDVSRWAGTKRSLHLYAQMLGKIKLAMASIQPNWMFTRLLLTPRGLTTGFIPWRGSSFDATIDVFDSTIVFSHSNGARVIIPLVPCRTVAEVYADMTAALCALQIPCVISTVPQEVPDTTPMHEDRRPSEYEPEAVLRWFQACTATAGVFDEWRTHFFGRAGLQVWWGGLDVALILFSGRHVTAPTNRGYIMKYDLDAELMNVGLFFGDEKTPPFFYGYIYPQPAGAEGFPIRPHDASWSSQLGEWVLAYDAVRRVEDPADAIRAFVDAIYEQCFLAAGWNRELLEYSAPPRRHHHT